MTESVLLAGLGGLVGLALAPLSFSLLTQLVPPTILNSTSVSISLPVLAFTLLVSLLTGVGFGVLPALQVTKQSSFEVLRQAGGRSAVAARRGALRGALVVTEVALSMVVVVAAALLMQTFAQLRECRAGIPVRWRPHHERALASGRAGRRPSDVRRSTRRCSSGWTRCPVLRAPLSPRRRH